MKAKTFITEDTYNEIKRLAPSLPKVDILRRVGLSRSYSRAIDWVIESDSWGEFLQKRYEFTQDERQKRVTATRQKLRECRTEEELYWEIKKCLRSRVLGLENVHLLRPEFSQEDCKKIRNSVDYEQFLRMKSEKSEQVKKKQIKTEQEGAKMPSQSVEVELSNKVETVKPPEIVAPECSCEESVQRTVIVC